MSATPTEPGWRPIDEAMRRSWDHGRMGGALLAMTIICGLVAVGLLLGLISIVVAVMIEGPYVIQDAVGSLYSPSSRMGAIYAIPALTFSIFATVFFVMTLARARATPAVAVTMFVIQYLFGVATPVIGQVVYFTSVGGDLKFLPMLIVSMAPAWLLGLFVTFGLCGYLLGGVRPNAYYRNRVGVPARPAAAGPA